MARDIGPLIQRHAEQTAPKLAQQAADEFTHAEYLADIARFRDFRPEAERMLWPSPIGPKWKN